MRKEAPSFCSPDRVEVRQQEERAPEAAQALGARVEALLGGLVEPVELRAPVRGRVLHAELRVAVAVVLDVDREPPCARSRNGRGSVK